MKKATRRDLPVDPERLRRQFPALTEEDLDAYVRVTESILAEPDAVGRSRLVRETMARARLAREAEAQGRTLTAGEARDLRYLEAVEKMQGRTSPTDGESTVDS